jgi:hypothetical protein
MKKVRYGPPPAFLQIWTIKKGPPPAFLQIWNDQKLSKQVSKISVSISQAAYMLFRKKMGGTKKILNLNSRR